MTSWTRSSASCSSPTAGSYWRLFQGFKNVLRLLFTTGDRGGVSDPCGVAGDEGERDKAANLCFRLT